MGPPHPGASKTHLFFIIFSMRFSIDFFSLLARFCIPTCLPKPTKIHQKSMPRGNPSWASIFGRFLIDFWCQLRPLDPQESSPRCSESTIYQKIAFRNLYRFFIDFGANMPSFSFQQSTKNASKSQLGRHHFLIDFCIDSLSILARFGKPTWSHVGHIFLQNGGALWHAPLFFVGFMFFFGFLAVLAPSWRHLGSILEGLGVDFGSFRCPFSFYFLSFWNSFFQQC